MTTGKYFDDRKPEKCPRCGGELTRDAVDIGVGVQYGPAGCPDCYWLENKADGLPLNADQVCKHGVAMDVHCCNCHSGFIFERDHVCPAVKA